MRTGVAQTVSRGVSMSRSRILLIVLLVVLLVFGLVIAVPGAASADPGVSQFCTGAGDFGTTHGECVSIVQGFVNNGNAEPVAFCKLLKAIGLLDLLNVNLGECVSFIRTL